jgi:hypothetical protein
MMLGGRVAEELVLNEISTGASNDIERATSIIRRMVTEWGMSDELGTITFGNNNSEQVFLGRDLGRERNYSEAVAYSIDKEVKRMMDECHAEATRLLSENMDKLTLIAETLKERETLQADEFLALMEGRSLEELDQKRAALLEEQKGMKKRRPKPQDAAASEVNSEDVPPEAQAAEAEEAVETVQAAESVQASETEDAIEEIPCIREENVVASNGEPVEGETKKAE